MNRFLCIALAAFLCQPASASPLCIRDRKPFALSSDKMKWTMTIVSGRDCIQGLRWSYMQIYEVSVVSGPTNGHLAIVGPGFRYATDAGKPGMDKFTLLINGKNRHNPGQSTLEVEVRTE